MTKKNARTKVVVAQLRRELADAVLEIAKVDATADARRDGIGAALRELAAEARFLAHAPGLASPGRLEALASLATSGYLKADAQERALSDLRRRVIEWSKAT